VVAGERFRLDQGQVLSYNAHRPALGFIEPRCAMAQPSWSHNLRFERMISMADQHVLVVRLVTVDFEVQSL